MLDGSSATVCGSGVNVQYPRCACRRCVYREKHRYTTLNRRKDCLIAYILAHLEQHELNGTGQRLREVLLQAIGQMALDARQYFAWKHSHSGQKCPSKREAVLVSSPYDAMCPSWLVSAGAAALTGSCAIPPTMDTIAQ